VLAVPFAVAGALLFVWLRAMENDIYFQIGLVVLIGLAAKNAILIVEFAQQGLLAGLRPLEAAVKAARLRFRPIVMTFHRFCLWRDAACHRRRRGCGCTPLHGNRCRRRHAVRDLHRDDFRAALFHTFLRGVRNGGGSAAQAAVGFRERAGMRARLVAVAVAMVLGGCTMLGPDYKRRKSICRIAIPKLRRAQPQRCRRIGGCSTRTRC